MKPIPRGWSVQTVAAVTDRPIKLDPRETRREKVRYVDIGLIDGPVSHLADAPTVLSAEAPSRCRQLIATGDTLYSTVRPYLRKVALVSEELNGEFASTGYAVLRPTEGLHPAFLYYFTLSKDFEEQILPLQKGVSYPAVLDREVRAQRVWFPKMREQRRIVEILEDHLSRLDAAQVELRRARMRANALWTATLSGAREGEDVALPEMADIQGGIQKQPKRKPVKHHFPFLRVANVTSAGLDLDDVHRAELFGDELSRLRLQRGDLLVVEGNGSPSQIGRAAMWDGSIEDCVHQNHLIRVRPRAGVLPGYLESVWNSPENRRTLMEVASSSSGLHTLSVTKLKKLQIPVPDIDRQREIVVRVEETRAALDRLLSSIAAAEAHGQALRRGVLAAAFEGKLTGRHTDSEVIDAAVAEPDGEVT